MTTAREAEQASDRPLDEAGAAELLDGHLSRRRMMRNAALTAGTVVAAGAGLAACSSSPTPSSSGSSGSGGSGDSSGGAASSTSSSGGSSSGSGSGGKVLGKTSDIPVGGGVIYADEKVVVTQPASGTFKGFSAICTHAGCTVNKVTSGLIECPCHGSRYSVTDGTVKGGPAPKALASENVSVQNGNVVLNS